MPAGRPRAIKSPEQFDKLVDEYVAKCDAEDEPVLLMGMILHLGLSSRHSLDAYGERPEFSHSVKRAKAFVEMQYEKIALNGKNQAGAIFALKNFGWKDKTEIEATFTRDAKELTDDELYAIASGSRTGTGGKERGQKVTH